MTEQQDKLVADHHYLITQCMKICKIPLKFHDDYYGDAAIGLCEAAIKFDRLNLNIVEFPAYSRRVIINRIHNLRKRSTRKKRQLVEVSIHAGENVEDETFQNNFDFMSTFTAICCLLLVEEQIIVRMMLDGYTYEEIGEELNITRSGVCKRLKRMRRRLSGSTHLAMGI